MYTLVICEHECLDIYVCICIKDVNLLYIHTYWLMHCNKTQIKDVIKCVCMLIFVWEYGQIDVVRSEYLFDILLISVFFCIYCFFTCLFRYIENLLSKKRKKTIEKKVENCLFLFRFMFIFVSFFVCCLFHSFLSSLFNAPLPSPPRMPMLFKESDWNHITHMDTNFTNVPTKICS